MKTARKKQTTFQTETLNNTSSFSCVFRREVATLILPENNPIRKSVFFCLITYFPENVFVRTAQKWMRNLKNINAHTDI
jgi:hypothetical protein